MRYSWGTAPTAYRFTGQRLEESLGLYYYRARWYDPALGRFVQPDPIVPSPGDPQQLNRFAYARNNPLKYTDPTGHWLETAWDIANIIWDIYEVRRDPSLLNIGALVLDVGTAILPLVPAGAGLIVRGGKAAKIATEAATHVDEVADLVRGIERFKRGGQAYRRAESVLELVQRGVPGAETLFKKLLNIERNPGAAFQVERALRYAEQLVGIEQRIQFRAGVGQVDLLLPGNRIIETKAWERWARLDSRTQKRMLRALRRQVTRYLSDVQYTLLIEFKGNIPQEALDLLRKLASDPRYGGRLGWTMVP
jgi:RHS repeat-associated protein